jgi:hypothetical protein
MAKITLCGSTRFAKEFDKWNARFTLQGHLVYSIAIPVHQPGSEVSPQQKHVLDEVHLAKIAASDEIFVLDVGGYVGESTRREIAFAKQNGKRIRFLHDVAPEDANSDSMKT